MDPVISLVSPAGLLQQPPCITASCLLGSRSPRPPSFPSGRAKVQNCGPHACVTRTYLLKHLPRITCGKRREEERECMYRAVSVHTCIQVHVCLCTHACGSWKPRSRCLLLSFFSVFLRPRLSPNLGFTGLARLASR